MPNNSIEATPANAATPSSGEQNNNTQPGAAPTSQQGQGNSNQGPVVTIPASEYQRLTRQDARARSFDRRAGRESRRDRTTNYDPNDANAVAIAEANDRAADAERRAMQAEVRGKVRDLLADSRYSSIPQTTKDLIVKSPHMLSEADNLDDAMLDIEDYLDGVLSSGQVPVQIVQNNNTQNAQPQNAQQPNAQPQNNQNQTQNAQPQNAQRETPPVILPGSSAPVDSATLEDTSNLRGPARSAAVLRNSARKQLMGVQEQ